MRVLIAEDDPVSMLVLRRSVQSLGHECFSARDGVAAWEIFLRERPDVVISDWLMPGMDGIEFCRRIRESETAAQGPSAPETVDGQPLGAGYTYFVFMTALGDKQHFLSGMQAGADDYLIKPVDLDELSARMIAASRVTTLHKKLLEQNAELDRLSRKSHEDARIDPLTQVGNRLRLREDLESLGGRVQRYGQRYSAALCDIDHFKRYNDRHGHLAGDEALLAVARAIHGELRLGDALYRYGGEEFLVLLPEQSEESAIIAMSRVRRVVERLALPHAANPPLGVVTLSVGVAAMVPDDAPPWDGWIRRADEALYRAKDLGRNVVCGFERGLGTSA
jgi:two-component system cell cycle response regulator